MQIDTERLREFVFTIGYDEKGVGVVVSRDGLEIWGWYDSGKEIKGGLAPWGKVISDSIDVGDIAKTLGGGGHKGAAGFVEILSDER